MTQDEQPTGSALTNYGFAAWVLYGILSCYGYWIAGSLGGLAITLAILAHEYRCHAVKIMDCTAAAFFAFSLVVTIAAGPALFKNFNPVLTWSLFAIVTWVTLLIGFPFTFQYAREQAPREIWDHPLFVRLNVILTLAFGLMFTVNAGLGIYWGEHRTCADDRRGCADIAARRMSSIQRPISETLYSALRA